MPVTTATVTVPQAPGRAPVSWVLSDAAAMTRRNLLRYLRLPNLLVFSTIQPVMFVLLFAYVFGGAIKGALPPGVKYINFLMPGIFVQTVIFGSTQTGMSTTGVVKAPPRPREEMLSGWGGVAESSSGTGRAGTVVRIPA